MSTASARSPSRMNVDEFLAWRADAPDPAGYELVGGVPLRLMAPTTIRHARIQRNAGDALRHAIAGARLSCEVFDTGPGVALGAEGDECRIPDVVVSCAPIIDDRASLVPEPLIVVEVTSPSTRLVDVNDKVEFYGDILSVRHYLVIEQDRRRIVHHGRGVSGALEPRFIRDGSIALDPPGITIAVEALYRETELATP